LGCPLPKELLEKQTLQEMYTSGNYITPKGNIYILFCGKINLVALCEEKDASALFGCGTAAVTTRDTAQQK
jgi:hypothetical protein